MDDRTTRAHLGAAPAFYGFIECDNFLGRALLFATNTVLFYSWQNAPKNRIGAFDLPRGWPGLRPVHVPAILDNAVALAHVAFCSTRGKVITTQTQLLLAGKWIRLESLAVTPDICFRRKCGRVPFFAPLIFDTENDGAITITNLAFFGAHTHIIVA
jgi:hypothetical protein